MSSIYWSVVVVVPFKAQEIGLNVFHVFVFLSYLLLDLISDHTFRSLINESDIRPLMSYLLPPLLPIRITDSLEKTMDLLDDSLIVDESGLVIAEECELAAHFRVLTDVCYAYIHYKYALKLSFIPKTI